MNSDLRVWGTLVVSIISLLWNLGNTIYTSRSTRRLRRQTVSLDEFRHTIREPIKFALAACEEIGARAEAIAVSAKPLDDMVGEVEQLNKDAISAIYTLSDRLEEADRSIFSPETGWLHRYELVSDKILEYFNDACDISKSDVQRKTALVKVKAELRGNHIATRTEMEQCIQKIVDSS